MLRTAPAVHPTEMNTNWEEQQLRDDRLVEQVLAGAAENADQSGLFDNNRPLDLGDKADDAEDYEDISDDDLPEEEEPERPAEADGPGLTDDGGTSHDTDYLFGEERGSSPIGNLDNHDEIVIGSPTQAGESQPSANRLSLPSLDSGTYFRDVEYNSKDFLANQDLSIPAPAESAEEFLKQAWPSFEKGKILHWNELLPTKQATWIGKAPLKPPKPLQLTKVALELAVDQEKLFRLGGAATMNKRQKANEAWSKGLVQIVEEEIETAASDEEPDYATPSPLEQLGGLGNITWRDLEVICEDWGNISDDVSQPEEQLPVESDDEEDAEWFAALGMQPTKKQKTSHTKSDSEIAFAPGYQAPSFDDFEQATAHAAKRVVLDLNDPNLLIGVRENLKKPVPGNNTLKRGNTGGLSRRLASRFNISNDEAYDALKENHQSKVRAVIGNVTLEHSMPALKLQWPYYRVKLGLRDARTYHRPSLKFNRFLNQAVFFSRQANPRKRKNIKGMSTKELFKESKDLTLGDNSTAMLLEYSEEHPTVLSNFGMANKVINYYRRKDDNDNSRPKLDVGETSVLLPEDRSPFAQFGFVESGETVPTLHNAMYRAPIFKQPLASTDFLVIRSSTGGGGFEWHLRNIEHAFVVGQQLPSMEIPGPNSRKVTNAAKNRMKMIAFRKIRHSPDQTIKIFDVTKHIPDTNDLQNRQKLKEFLKYHKDEKVWKMKPGETCPAEETIRSFVKPEEVCTIDAMQVGLRHLEDAGYGGTAAGEDDDEEELQVNSLEQQLAPWKTTKNFLDASAGKAMLQLHGDGDPSGCGVALNFIKTSMKGGYLETLAGPQATSEDAIARERKANGGHKYNVDKQSEAYNSAIREIWEKQTKSLSETVAPEYEHDGHPEDTIMDESFGPATTPFSATTPAIFDDTASQFSRFSTSSRQGRTLKISRTIRTKNGQLVQEHEVVKDQRVWREYLKRRHERDIEKVNVYEAKPTGDADLDKRKAVFVKNELARLERNRERRYAREKQKGRGKSSKNQNPDDPDSVPNPSDKPVGTTRKCAICGQAGHIKTNKKLCPMLNGTMKPEEGQSDHGFGAIAVPFAA